MTDDTPRPEVDRAKQVGERTELLRHVEGFGGEGERRAFATRSLFARWLVEEGRLNEGQEERCGS